MEIVRIDEFIPCHSDVCSQVIRVCRLIWQVFVRKIDKRLIASVSPCDLDYRDFLSHLDLSLYFAPLRVWKYKGVFLPLRLNIFRDKQPAWKVRLLVCVITVRASYFDTDFASKMKLAKLPLIYCLLISFSPISSCGLQNVLHRCSNEVKFHREDYRSLPYVCHRHPCRIYSDKSRSPVRV